MAFTALRSPRASPGPCPPRCPRERGPGEKTRGSCGRPLWTQRAALWPLSVAHLLGRHRPLPRAAPAALGGTTAALRHLHRLPGIRRVALRHFRQKGSASSLGTPPTHVSSPRRMVLAVSTCKTCSLSRGRGDSHQLYLHLCHGDTTPGEGGLSREGRGARSAVGSRWAPPQRSWVRDPPV